MYIGYWLTDGHLGCPLADCPAYRGLNVIVMGNVCYVEPNRPDALQPSGHYVYHQFHVQQFYVLLTQCIYVFCVELRTNSDYFPIQQ